MEAVCPKCQMRYEVSQELLDQGGPIQCPTCQVELVLVQPGTNIPLGQEQESDAAPASDAAQESPGPQAQAETTPEEQSAAGQPTGPGGSWDAGSLLWGDPASGSDMGEPAEQQAEAWPQDKSEAVTQPDSPPESQGQLQPPAELQPDQSSDLSSVANAQASAEEEPAAEQQQEQPHHPPELQPDPAAEEQAAEEQPPAEEQAAGSQPETEQVATFETPAWGAPAAVPEAPAEQPQAERSEAEQATEEQPAEDQQQEIPQPPAELQPDLSADLSSIAAAKEEAPAEEEAGVQAPVDAEDGEQAPAEVQVPSEGGTQPASGPPPGIKGDDWASAAAQWAASGFSSDNMPEFVRGREEQAAQQGILQAAPAAAEGVGQEPVSAGPETEALPEVEPVGQTEAGAEQQAAQAEPPTDQAATAPGAPEPEQPAAPPAGLPAQPGAAPPPLPKPGIELPSPQVPPPLDSKRRSTYVMRGSGEGLQEGKPWDAAQTSEAPEATTPSEALAGAKSPLKIKLPDVVEPLPEEAPVAKPAKVEVPKPSRTGFWVLLVILIIAGGVAAAWWVVKELKILDEGAPSPTDTIEKPEAPADEEPGKKDDSAKPSEDDTQPVKDEKPGGTDKDVKVAGTGDKKPAAVKKDDEKPVPDKKPAKKKKKRRVAVHKKPKRDPGKAKEFYKKGNLMIRKKRFQAAVKEFRKALKADSKMALAHRGLGIAYAQLRQNKAACREYRIYSKLIPKDSKEMPALRQILKSCK